MSCSIRLQVLTFKPTGARAARRRAIPRTIRTRTPAAACGASGLREWRARTGASIARPRRFRSGAHSFRGAPSTRRDTCTKCSPAISITRRWSRFPSRWSSAVPEQTWSSAAFLTASVQGLLGLRADGAARLLTFAPHLPSTWDKVGLRRVRIGDSRITIELTQAVGELTLRITNEGGPLKMSFDPELPLGASVPNARLGERALPATLVQHAQDTHAHIELDLPRGESVVRLAYSGGVAIVPSAPRPAVGERSRGMKIVGVSLKDRTYTIEIDHLASEPTRFELRTPWKIEAVQGAQLLATAPSSYRIEIGASADSEQRAHIRSKVLVTFANVE